MAEKVLINGEAVSEISSYDRGLQYGDGLFETIVLEQGKLLCWDEHMSRLDAGCERLNIPQQDKAILKSEALSLSNSNEKSIIKIIVTRGLGGRGYAAPEKPKPQRIITLFPFPEHPTEYSKNGISARICDYKYAHNAKLAGIKHLNRLEQVLARSEWSDSDIAEGIVLDSENNIIEGTMSNLFCVKNRVLSTPDLSLCGVEGVIRNKIIDVAPTLGMEIQEKKLSLDELQNADEIFVCNSVIGIWPVTQLKEKSFSVGEITNQIRKALQDGNSIPA